EPRLVRGSCRLGRHSAGRFPGGLACPAAQLLKSGSPPDAPPVNAIPDQTAIEPEAQDAEGRIVALLLARQQLKDVDLSRARRLQEETGGGILQLLSRLG